MGTREVYEEKLRSGAHLHRDPTIKPGLGSPRCPRCLSLLNPTAGEGDWAITSVLHDATAVAGSGAGALLSAVHGFNTGIPFVQKHVKGPKWLQLLVGVPPLLMFSGASAVFGDLPCCDRKDFHEETMLAISSCSLNGLKERDVVVPVYTQEVLTVDTEPALEE